LRVTPNCQTPPFKGRGGTTQQAMQDNSQTQLYNHYKKQTVQGQKEAG